MDYSQPIGAEKDAPYVDCNPAAGIEGSPVPATAIEHPQREIVHVIKKAGLEPNPADLEQLYRAVQTLVNAGKIDVSGLIAKAAMPGYGTFSARKTVATSGLFTVETAGPLRIGLVGAGGGGGGGGDVVNGKSGRAGKKGGDTGVILPAGAVFEGATLTAPRTVTAKGGSSGGGGAASGSSSFGGSGGGGGEAGEYKEIYVRLEAGMSLTFFIGAAGLGGKSMDHTSAIVGYGEDGEGAHAGKGAWYGGGAGAPGAGDGASFNANYGGGAGGNGAPGREGYGYGGAGAGGRNTTTGRPGPGGASEGARGADNAAGPGGDGGPGVVWIEYQEAV